MWDQVVALYTHGLCCANIDKYSMEIAFVFGGRVACRVYNKDVVLRSNEIEQAVTLLSSIRSSTLSHPIRKIIQAFC